MVGRTVLVMAAALSLAGSLSAARAEDRVVKIYNWADYIDESILEDFTRQTGIKVVYDTFESKKSLETKLLAGRTGFDVVVPSAKFLARHIKAGLFRKLDKSQLPNLKNMWGRIEKLTAGYDPDNQYGIDYMWGTMGIGYNRQEIKARLGTGSIDSWKVVFDPAVLKKIAGCGVYFLDSPADILSAALDYLGLDPNSHKAADLEKAEALLLKVRPYVRKFDSSDYVGALADGRICLAVGWSDDVFLAHDRAEDADEGVDIAYAIPKEGAEAWFDMMAIPADAQHVEAAHEFLNYMMRPEVIARATNYVVYANGNKASRKYVDPDILKDPAVYPDEAAMNRLYTLAPVQLEMQPIVSSIWSRVLAAH